VPANNRRGFTLIEVLIAMTLLSIMVILLFSSLRMAAESWNAGENKIIEVNKKAVVYQFFKRHLATIKPVSLQAAEDGSMPEPGFQGQNQFMRFVAGLPASSARKGLQIFTVGFDTDFPSSLMVTLSPYQQNLAGQTSPEKVVLLENVKNYSFSYFGSMDETGNSGWQEQWTILDRLPQLIKVSIVLDDDSLWPEMVFPVRINTPADATISVGADILQQQVPR